MSDDTMAIIPDEVVANSNLPAVTSASSTLFNTADPLAVVDKASKVAKALSAVIERQKLYANIGSGRHVTIDGWTLCGSMLGVFPVTVWTRDIMRDKVWIGSEARVVAQTISGSIVGAAEAQCLNTEANWKDREEFAIRSMAQTRATSKAMRMPLGFVIQLAGFVSTPAEEMQYMKEASVQAIKPPQRKKATPKKAKKAVKIPDQVGPMSLELDGHLDEVLEDEEEASDGMEEMLEHFSGSDEAYQFPTYKDKKTKEEVQLTPDDYTPFIVEKLDTHTGNTNGKPWTIWKYTLSDPATDEKIKAGGFDKRHATEALLHNHGLGTFNAQAEPQLHDWKSQRIEINLDNPVVYVALTKGRTYQSKGVTVQGYDVQDLTTVNVKG